MHKSPSTKRPTILLSFLAAFFVGLLFAGGLVLSGMTNPEKIIGFLDILRLKNGWSFTPDRSNNAAFLAWDPSLALVMGGALLVTMPSFWWLSKREQPLFATQFSLPTKTQIEPRLLIGAGLFGAGWALVGYCPGPAVASVLTGGVQVAAFLFAMLVAMKIARKFHS